MRVNQVLTSFTPEQKTKKFSANFLWYNMVMQKIATRIFVCASIAFGIIGIFVVLTLPDGGDANSSDLHILLMKLLFATVFIILPSFALSAAGRYLIDR
jgi:hypothetical protein